MVYTFRRFQSKYNNIYKIRAASILCASRPVAAIIAQTINYYNTIVRMGSSVCYITGEHGAASARENRDDDGHAAAAAAAAPARARAMIIKCNNAAIRRDALCVPCTIIVYVVTGVVVRCGGRSIVGSHTTSRYVHLNVYIVCICARARGGYEWLA